MTLYTCDIREGGALLSRVISHAVTAEGAALQVAREQHDRRPFDSVEVTTDDGQQVRRHIVTARQMIAFEIEEVSDGIH